MPDETGQAAATSRSGLAQVIRRAHADPGFRGRMIWFPDQIISEYALDGAEARAVRTGDVSAVELDDETREIAAFVYDLHDLHSGE